MLQIKKRYSIDKVSATLAVLRKKSLMQVLTKTAVWNGHTPSLRQIICTQMRFLGGQFLKIMVYGEFVKREI